MLTSVSITAAKEIASEAFAGFASLQSLWLCDGIQTIGENAFADCKALMEVSLPASLESYTDLFPEGSVTIREQSTN